MATRRYFANACPQQTLSAQITSGATTCAIAGTFSGWPTQFPFNAALDKGTASAEIVSVTAIVGTTATITRGQGGTAAVSHPAGATIDFVVVAQDFDDANLHVTSNSGVHGVSGSVVGTSDAQTLTNKTISGGTLTGSIAASGATITGQTINNPVLTGTMTGGGAVNITGGVTTAGAVAATGNVTGATVAANGNGTVSGVVVPKSYTNEAAATAALPTPTTGTVIYLSAPTGAGFSAGHYYWNGTAWTPVESQAGQLLGENGSLSTVTIATSSATAASASVTFTLATQRRVRIVAACDVQAATAPASYNVRAAYNAGGTVGTPIVVGFGRSFPLTATGSAGINGASAENTIVLAAGTYTAYATATRLSGGSASDLAGRNTVAVYDAGPV